ncbi:hypothetical protein KEM09_01330 [Carboxylicivirga mesophila]|uniref:Calx-beta domain-containing protein n=1 Tax=Carboxylicivirga mesophila TaxID=1166478 RepID=A0ABS5K4U1_9BACT|nr:hypothetical protein [Carboxylicivirga mesophila]MBS2210025.1 hypothetical protein [Carboxylicivirga mesophila]
MKTYNLTRILLVVVAFVFFACSETEEPESIYVYFKEKSSSVVESHPDEIRIPVKVFATSDMVDDLTMNYALEGNEKGIVSDKSNGILIFESGYAAYTSYITLGVNDNATGDGDVDVVISLSSTANVTLGIGEGANNTNGTFTLTVLDDDIACLAELWTGDVNCTDNVWPSWSPSYCIGEKVGDDCQRLNLTFDFWAMSSLETFLELELGPIDPDTKQGNVTLLNDYNAVGGGYDVTFHAGPAGTYNGNTFELNLELQFSGYDIGGDGIYRFTVKK